MFRARESKYDVSDCINNAVTISVCNIVSKIASKEDADFIFNKTFIGVLRQ